MRERGAVLVMVGALLIGCGERALDPGNTSRIVIGVIDAGGSLDSAIVGPSSGAVGEPLSFRVTTFGNSCVTSAGAQVINQGLQMTVIPYDSISAGPCQHVLRSIPRDVTLVFDRSGSAFLHLQGQAWAGKSPVVTTRQLLIQP